MSGAGDNYEAVDMEESDGSGSDNEAFASKQEYKAYKEQFNVSKVGERLELRLDRETIGCFYRVPILSTYSFLKRVQEYT